MLKYFLWGALLVGATPLAVRAQAAPAAQVRPLPPFRAIQVGGNIALAITAGHAQRVEVSAATADFREHLVTKVEDEVLLLSYDDLLERDDRKLMKADHQLRVAVTADFITKLTATGGATIASTSNFVAPDCLIDASSAASVVASGLAPQVLVVRESTKATVTLAGTAPRLDVRTNSGATFDGQQLQSTNCQVEANDGSTIRVYTTQELLLEANSNAKVYYSGPAVVTKNLNGGSAASAK